MVIEMNIVIEKKRMLEKWIADTVEGDANLGRTGECFAVDPAKAVSQRDLRRMRDKGIICYSGSGNYIQADMNDRIRIIHRRPLAQRYVMLVPGGHS